MSTNSKQKSKYLDDAGIRLAPTPVQNEAYVVMPSIKQEFVIAPELNIDEPERDDQARTLTTEDDFQPKKKDISFKWKRRRRAKNIVLGTIMLAASLVMLLPYVLGAAGVFSNGASFMFIPKQFGALHNIIEAIKISSQNGWKGAAVNECWLNCVPSFMLLIGIICIFINLIKSVIGLFGAIKPRRYFIGALIYLLMVIAVLITCLVGAPSIGVGKTDFIADVIKGYRTSEIFAITILALAYMLVSAVCSIISSEKYGYLK